MHIDCMTQNEWLRNANINVYFAFIASAFLRYKLLTQQESFQIQCNTKTPSWHKDDPPTL